MDNKFTLNMDFSKNVCIRPEQQNWVESPADGVSRVHLEREAEESGHTSSFVKFKAGSFFPKHSHPMGEEIYVIEGIFSDENGDYPAGTYIRNPPNSFHSPFTKTGCTLFVKLEQFDSHDTAQITLRPEQQQWRDGIGGLRVVSLHEFETKSTALVFWPKNEVFQPHTHWGGEEILVIKGCFIDEHGSYPKNTWIRSPHMSQHYPRVEEESLILVKVGHL